MRVLYLILYIVAALCFALAALAPEKAPTNRVVLLPLGLFAWVLVPLIQTIDALGD